jgi:two-component sensor histidine kinase
VATGVKANRFRVLVRSPELRYRVLVSCLRLLSVAQSCGVSGMDLHAVTSRQVAFGERTRRAIAGRYGIAVAAFAISLLIRAALNPWLFGARGSISVVPRGYILFVPAVLLVTYYAGLGPGLLTAVLSGLSVWYFFVPASHSFTIGTSDALALPIFAVSIVLVNSLRIAKDQVSQRLNDLRRLHQLSSLLVRQGSDFNGCLRAVVKTAIAICGATKGDLQLFDQDVNALTIVAQEGFEQPFLDLFKYVHDDPSTCAAAMRSAQRVIVEDVAKSEIFAGQPSLDVLLEAGVRAVISTPLTGSSRKVTGIISVHFGKPHRPSEHELHALDLLAAQTADYLERKRSEEIETLLMRELQHRSNNLLAVVQSIAHRSLAAGENLADARQKFESRLQALARANRRISNSNGSGVNFRNIVTDELSTFPDRTTIDGSQFEVNAQQAQKFSLVLHELMTNAVKYGALSGPNGSVKVSWSLKRDSAGPILSFRWEERDGPRVVPPSKQGFGSQLIKISFPDGRTNYGPGGLTFEMDVPVGQATPDHSADATLQQLSVQA